MAADIFPIANRKMSNINRGDDVQRMQIEITWKQCLYNAIVGPFGDVSSYPLVTEQSYETLKCPLDVFVHGNLEQLDEKIVFLTVHDVGKTYLSFVDLANSPTLSPLMRQRAVFLHVSVPGQEAGAENVVGDFPSMEQLGNGLAQVLEKLNVRKCIAIGEGAGADIVCRFAMNFQQHVIGAVLVHCTSTTHGIIASIKELFTNLLLDDGHMTNSAWNWLLVHKFGNHEMNAEQRHYVDAMKAGGMNEHNLSRYLYAFSHRDEFTDRLKDQLGKVDVLLVTGGKAPHNENVRHMFKRMTKTKTVLLVAEGVVDVVAELPEYVANSIILLCQRHGIFSDVVLPIINQQNADDSSA
uniref:AB hydrolase-1 domain-containing protein n=1 Tax=Globodera pallida TaxID=36090 RepID=A0A183BLV7_GLOPA